MERPDTDNPFAPPRSRLRPEELGALARGRGPGRLSLRGLYLRTAGRIPRRTFWLHGVLSLLAVAMLGNALLDIAGLAGDVGGKLVNLVLAWPYIAITAKRLHDFNRSAWWVLVNFVPGIGSLVLLAATGFVPGTRGPNDYGPDPLAAPHGTALNISH